VRHERHAKGIDGIDGMQAKQYFSGISGLPAARVHPAMGKYMGMTAFGCPVNKNQ
jgi:hypothetical protein